MERINKVHFIGIGGIGMSGLARLYMHEGADVSGSDREDKPLLGELEKENTTIYRNSSAENVSSDTELVIYSDAVSEDDPERMRARELGIPQKQYFEALGDIANQYYLIAVAGTHGKTTTTAMLTDILEDAGLDPTAIVGSLRSKAGSNFRAGKSKYFIAEADEYRNHFQYLNPDLLIITNIEFDHPDYFTDIAHVQSTFRALAERVPDSGAVITDIKASNIAEVVDGLSCAVIDYQSVFDPMLALPQPGIHNQLNAAAAHAAAVQLDIAEQSILIALKNFTGTQRRFEYKGICNGARVFDDYAHHPSEIKAAISGARDRYPEKTVTVVFQPHTYSRTKELRGDFVAALARADQVILVPIYAAREADDESISSEMLAEEIGAQYAPTLDDATNVVREMAGEDHIVLVMGAGDVTTVADMLV